MNLEYPKKWRETIDLETINFKKIKVKEVLGYPYAANQVFAVWALEEGIEKLVFIKYNDHLEANLKNEVAILRQINLANVPRIIEYADDYSYVVTEALEGVRLSIIIGDNLEGESWPYMFKYGQMLAKLHQIKGDFPPAPQRRFAKMPTKEQLEKWNLAYVMDFLKENQPKDINQCFVHGDFHYANILWCNQEITGILDFELAGIGNREFDIAWSLILRPEQKFMNTKAEIFEFLRGYQSLNTCNLSYIKYYMALIYAHFIELGDEEYRVYIKKWYQDNLQTKDLTKYLGRQVKITIDRPMGSKHPQFDYIYPLNYGYLANTISGDGEEIDAYLLGVYEPVREYTGVVVAIIKRLNDEEDKLVVAPLGSSYSAPKIKDLVYFQEQYFQIEVISHIDN